MGPWFWTQTKKRSSLQEAPFSQWWKKEQEVCSKTKSKGHCFLQLQGCCTPWVCSTKSDC